ncbi:hypothetical protein EVAR_41104_1 [Eumeta japonica]|uniref:Mos1 transposase HTH domain-containing protein n=1 Tax=Eumeta variegata TaxID=151549 RepID=A0A4C1XF02_EUMVA|nr:hypothetical protein EVAR_41104_1 [Eumeta japonica]
MELEREKFNAIIYHSFRRELYLNKCLVELVSTYDVEAPGQTIIDRWCCIPAACCPLKKFRRSGASLSTLPSTGQPKTAMTPESVIAVKKFIRDDRHVTYEQIQAIMSIRITSIQIILHYHSGPRELISRWVQYHYRNTERTPPIDTPWFVHQK